MARQESFQGSLPLLILKILARRGPLHGYGITVRIQEISEDILRVEEGSLYPALHRMAYEITVEGRKWLDAEEKRWLAVNAALVRVLRHA